MFDWPIRKDSVKVTLIACSVPPTVFMFGLERTDSKRAELRVQFLTHDCDDHLPKLMWLNMHECT